MYRRIHLLVLMVLISAVKSKRGGVPHSHQEADPLTAAKKDLESLPNDTLSKIREFESMAANLASRLSDYRSISTDDVDVSVLEFDITRSAEQTSVIDFGHSTKSRVEIPIKTIQKLPQAKLASKVTVVIAWWKRVGNLPSPGRNAILPRQGAVLTVSYFINDVYQNSKKRSLPVNYYIDLEGDITDIETLASNERLRGVDRVCAWLDLSTDTWKKSGCNATFNGKGVSCECNHTTTFVTLLVLDKEITMPNEVNLAAMVFEIVSIVCLFLTIIFICVARQGAGINSNFILKATGMTANRTNSQVSLCATLLALHSVLVWCNFARQQSDQGCVACTALSHYFLLASAFWSLCEGFGIFAKMFPSLTMVIPYRTMTIIQAVVGWGVPLVIAIATAAYGIPRGVYMDEVNAYKQYINRILGIQNDSFVTPRYGECWLSKTSDIVWAALGPLIFVAAVNLVILCYVTKEVVKMNRKHPERAMELSDSQSGGSRRFSFRRRASLPRIQKTVPGMTTSSTNASTEFEMNRRRYVRYLISVIRSFGILMPILSVPWILAILSNIPSAGVVLSAAHAVVNGLQGFQIFLLYCVVSKQDWKVVKRKWRNSKLTHFFVKYNYRRDSIANASNRVIYETKSRAPGIDSNGNNFLGAGWMNGIPVTQYDTLSSCRSSSGTINSRQSLQRSGKSPVKKSSWCWKK